MTEKPKHLGMTAQWLAVHGMRIDRGYRARGPLLDKDQDRVVDIVQLAEILDAREKQNDIALQQYMEGGFRILDLKLRVTICLLRDTHPMTRRSPSIQLSAELYERFQRATAAYDQVAARFPEDREMKAPGDFRSRIESVVEDGLSELEQRTWELEKELRGPHDEDK